MDQAAVPRLDHVVVNVQDRLGEAASRFAGLGFTLTEPSHHTLGSMNRLALFDDHYIELLGIDPTARTPREELMHSPVGLNALVFATDDAAQLHTALRARGVPVEAPRDFSRPVVGAGEARFRTVHVAADTVPYGRLYFCQHFTRQIVWGAAPHRHRNGAVAVARIAVETRDPDRAADLLRGVFGEASVRAEGTGFVLAVGPMRVEIRHGGQDRIASLTVRTRSLATVRDMLGATALRVDGARLSVAPEAACGAVLEFAE